MSAVESAYEMNCGVIQAGLTGGAGERARGRESEDTFYKHSHFSCRRGMQYTSNDQLHVSYCLPAVHDLQTPRVMVLKETRPLTFEGFGSMFGNSENRFPLMTLLCLARSTSPVELNLIGKIDCASRGAPRISAGILLLPICCRWVSPRRHPRKLKKLQDATRLDSPPIIFHLSKNAACSKLTPSMNLDRNTGNRTTNVRSFSPAR
jgi:hypothetical protein